MKTRWAFLLLLAFPAQAQKYYTYLMDLGPTSVELAWGTTTGSNTIGRSSPSLGPAEITIAGKKVVSKANNAVVAGLEPDHKYTYEISIGSQKIGSGEFRTWAEKANRLTFFVIGDFGTGREPQLRIAQAMWREFQQRAQTDNPVRFMLSMGDNIYGDVSGFLGGAGATGAEDRDWTTKFFDPYEPLLKEIPFFGTLGNHDGNETESTRDLSAYLDNFPFPGGKPGHYYEFTYGGLAHFFGLDSTKNTESGRPHANYHRNGEQFQWMERQIPKATEPWVIPYYHHPVLTAGPLHGSNLRELAHWVELFRASRVKVIFNGHEHNFQMSEAWDGVGGMRFIVSGAGGELRGGNIQSSMVKNHIAAWAPRNHFLVVEIEDKTMKITPLSYELLSLKDAQGHDVKAPFVITLP